MSLETIRRQKHLTAEFTHITKSDDGERGIITVKASSFGTVDRDGDIFMEGAFDEALGRNLKLPMLWQHDAGDPIGHWTDVWIEGKFVMMKGRITLTIPQGNRAYENLKAGDINAVSIGFGVKEYSRREDDKGRLEGFNFIKIDLWECSVVTFPANQLAEVVGVKNNEPISKRDAERLLRDVGGLSVAEAKSAIAERYREYAESQKARRDDAADSAKGKRDVAGTISLANLATAYHQRKHGK